MKSIVNWVFLFFLLQMIGLCIIASISFMNLESTVTLLIFNFLFASLTFQLNGKMSRKLGLLALGNFVGLFWNFVFFKFALTGAEYFATFNAPAVFDAFYTIIYPILNLMWIVPFWSLSLSVFPKMQHASAVVD